MNKNEYMVILVYTTSHALKAEKVLANVSIGCKLMPVPRNLSSDCGVCLRIKQSDEVKANNALHLANLDIEGIHPIPNKL